MPVCEAQWGARKQDLSPETRDALITRYVYLAKYVVDRLNVPESGAVSRDDLIGHAIVGLIDAVERFDPERGVKFETYAITRIRGAVVDTLRSLDWAPRSVRKTEAEVRAAFARIEAAQGRPATDEQVAHELGITLDEFHATLADISQAATVSLDEKFQNGLSENGGTLADIIDGPENPADLAEVEERKRLLMDAIGALPERERLVVGLYYYEGLTLKEIGLALSVTEARACQIHGKAVTRLNARLERMRPVFCG